MKLFLALPLLLTLVYQIKGTCDLEQAWRLYFCAHSGFEDAYVATHPRPSGPVNVDSTHLCGALGKFSQCEEETECKEMAKGLLYTTASQLHTSSHTREIGCAKDFVEKHGNPDHFAEDGTCSIHRHIEMTSMDDDYVRFVKCMTRPFDSFLFDYGEKHEFCDALEMISKCGEAVPSCYNDFRGLAHAIANFPDLYDAKKPNWRPWRNEPFPNYTPSNDPVKLACFEKFIEKHNKTSLMTDEENTNQEDLWSKIEKLNQKFLADLKLAIDEA